MANGEMLSAGMFGGSSSGGGGGGTGTANQLTITQANSFAAGNGIYNNAGTWALAKANALATSIGVGVVSSATGSAFTVVLGGQITLSGLTANSQYYLSDVTAGLLTVTAPTSTTSFVVNVLTTGTTTTANVEVSAPASLALIPVASGGTGASSLTGLLLGSGTSAISAIASGTNTNVLTMVAGAPAWAAASGGISGLTNTQVVYATGATTISGNANFISDISGNVTVNSLGIGTAPSGTIHQITAGALTIDANSSPVTIRTSSGALALSASNGLVNLPQGNTIQITGGGTFGRAGTFTLVSGIATVAQANVTSGSVIIATLKTKSGTITGSLYYPTITAGTGFTVAEVGGVTDNSTYNYIIFETA